VQPGIVLDFNKEGVVIGIEMLNISKRIPKDDLKNFHYENA